MKIIAIAAVTAGGKTTVVNELKRRLKNAVSLHFDDYTFDGEVEDFAAWVKNGANYERWDLSPLVKDIERLKAEGKYDYILLDYPFAHIHSALRFVIDHAFFIDTPLDIAMARRVLRDMKEASADEIRADMKAYLDFARPAYLQMLKDILPSSDLVVDGSGTVTEIVDEILAAVTKA